MTRRAIPKRPRLTLLAMVLLLGCAGAPAVSAAGEDDEATRLAAQVERLTSALVDSDLAKIDAMHRTWDSYYQELWGNTPEARARTQIAFDSSPGGEALRARISGAARRVEETRAALAERERGAHNPPTPEEQLEILRARVVHLQTKLDADNATIAYQQGLGAFAKDEVTGWTDTWVKAPFYEFAHAYVGPFLNQMWAEVISEAQSRLVETCVNQDLGKLNPGIGAEQAAKGFSKLVKMAIKSGMNVEMRALFQKRLNELAGASGVDPIPGDVSSFMFDYYVLAKAQASLEENDDAQRKWRDKILKALLKKALNDHMGDWARSAAGEQAAQQYLDEFGGVWKEAMTAARAGLPGSADTPEAKERLLAAARDRVKQHMASRKGAYAETVRAKLTEELNRTFEAYTRDPKRLTDGLSWLDTADFAVNDVAVPIITVWMNGADFEAIVANELDKYHIVNEFVKRKTNSRMTLALFREWFPRYEEIARYRDRWDLVVQVESLEVPDNLDLPFLVTLRYAVRGVSALSEMVMHWTLVRPNGTEVDWDARTTFADEYELETSRTQPARWEWLLTAYEVKNPGLYTVGVTVAPNYAPLGENPIAGPKLRGWTAERQFYFGRPDSTTVLAAGEDSSAAWPDSDLVAERDDLPDADDELEDLLDEIDRQIVSDVDVADLLGQFELIAAELQSTAENFNAMDRFFHQRMDEGRSAACSSTGLAYSYAQSEELAADYAQGLIALDEIAAQLLAAAEAGAAGVDPVTAGTVHAGAVAIAAAQAELLADMRSILDTFACDENALGQLADVIADPDADPDQVAIGGYAGGTGDGSPPPGGGDGSLDADGDGYTGDEGDCDDADPDVYPGAPEILDDHVDNDCDEEIDEGEGSVPVLSNLSHPTTAPGSSAYFMATFHFVEPDGDLTSLRIGITIWHDGEANSTSFVLPIAGNPDFTCLLGTEADCTLPMEYSGLEDGDTFQFSFSVIDRLGHESNTLIGNVTIVG